MGKQQHAFLEIIERPCAAICKKHLFKIYRLLDVPWGLFLELLLRFIIHNSTVGILRPVSVKYEFLPYYPLEQYFIFLGYGSVSPRTSWGKLVTIIYALIGIPLMLLYLSATGDVLARSFRRLYGKMCGTSPQKLQCPCSNTVRVPVTLCLVIVLAYICSGAVLFHRLENWSLLEGNQHCPYIL